MQIQERVSDSVDTEYLDAAQLSKKLNVSKKSINNWTQSHRLPFVKIGRLVRYSTAEIERRLLGGALLYEKK